MRINNVQFVGLALALVGSSAEVAEAGDVSISTATTTPVTTAAADGVSPGNVTITSSGSIAVTAGQTGVTVNSNNTVSNAGALTSTDANNTTGISLLGGFTGAITNSGVISLLEPYIQTDADSDGDLDGAFALGANRNGIFLQSGAAYTGTITNTGVISIEGNNSAGVRLDARLIGSLISSGSIGVIGDNSRGVAINGGVGAGVSGDVSLTGATSAQGAGSISLLVGAPITGALRLNGSVINSAYHSTTRPLDAAAAAKLDADDKLQGGGAVVVQYGVGGGITIAGIGVENDTDDDGDGITDAAGDGDDNLSGKISVFGSAPAILIRPDAGAPVNLALGATASGFGFLNRGNISANGILDGFDATGIRIEGVGGATVTTAGGLRNDGIIGVTAFEANSYGVYIGAGATVPSIINRNALSSVTTAETAKSAYGYFFAPGAHVTSLTNYGAVSTQLFGEIGTTYAILDQSNTLATITNSGLIQSQLIATGGGTITGAPIAIDVSASNIAVTFNQIADVPFTDDDAVDDDLATRPVIRTLGSVLFGSGADTVNLLAGEIIGNMAFGAGADTFLIDNGARYAGKLSDSDGALSINVLHGTLGLAGGPLNITTAHFGPTSELAVLLATVVIDSTKIVATGNVTFDAGALITPIIPVGLPVSGTHVFLTANGGLTGASNVTRIVTGTGSSFIYDLSIGAVVGDPNSLQASYVLKTPIQLGLDPNETIAFNPVIAALRTDSTAGAAFAGLSDSATFHSALDSLLPNFASAAAELATTAIQQSQSATSNRLAATRVSDLHDVSLWAQEIGYGLSRTPKSFGVEYDGFGFGIAGGIDGPLDNGALLGLSASFIASEVSEPGRKDGELSTSFGQFNGYLGSSLGPVDLDFIAGVGVGRLSSRRFVEIGATYDALSTADWWAYEGHGSVRASVPMHLTNWLVISPHTALTYVALSENGYQESGGGSAVDLDIDSTVSQRLWGDVGVEFAGHFGRTGQTIYAPRLSLGYRANLIDEAGERTLRFTGGSDFTLTDEKLGSGGPLIGIGFDATNGYSTFSLTYEGEFGDQLQRNSLNASVRFRF